MTHSRRFLFIAVPLLICAASAQTMAQFRSGITEPYSAAPPPSVLSPAPSQWWIGPQIGASLITHRGDFTTAFCNCSFDDGSGAGIAVGIEAGHMLAPWLGLALKAVYNDMGADYSYKIMRDVINVETKETVSAEHERRNRIDLGYFMLNPVLQFHPFTGAYVFMGPAFGFNTTGITTYTLAMTDERYIFDQGDPDARTIAEDTGEIPGLEKTRLDFRVGVGANIRLGRSFLLAPEVSYNLPLGTISNDDNWEAEAIHLIAVLKFEL